MPKEKVFEGKIEFLQILDEQGNLDDSLEPKLKNSELDHYYKTMVFCRIADDKALALQRQGRVGTFAPTAGQEAAQIASASLLRKTDWLVPSFREAIAAIVRGTPLHKIYQYISGVEEASRLPEGCKDLPVSIPVGSQMLHAVGLGYAEKLKGTDNLALTYFGDGATSEGEFHEAANLAGVYQTPTIFFCQNNQWAISVPRSRQTHSKTIAQKAFAYGMAGVQVDGNDILAVHTATADAIERARNGQGPTLIEAVTYRQKMHTTADDPTKYRDPKVHDEWMKKDPISRFKIYLKYKGIWSEEYEKQVWADAQAKVEEEVKIFEALKAPPIEDMFKYVYAEMPEYLIEEMEELKQAMAEKELEQ
ncbi:MAG: pyruvate dehydrogenase (acetyl-transferring) E1 component subunit alpha [Candidatus Diapherotrites archaeon]|nr:pyruvate dehydrogenase (acetyl-transferring) E1 component subunit alpha [Candidatus Diapherotrites archaeon]